MTYSEATGFYYDNRHSSDFGILRVHTNSGLFEEHFLPNRSIVEEKTFGRHEPYFFGHEYSPIEIPLTLYFEDGLNEFSMHELVNWLCQDKYQPLIFDSEYGERIFYCMYVGDPRIIHNGIKNGYVNLTMRCNSPYAYSHFYEQTHTYSNNALGTDLTFINYGQLPIYPKFTIEKIGNGDITIVNHSNNGEEMKFTGLLDKEVVTVDGNNLDIKTSLTNTYRYNNHNGTFLEMPFGHNNLRVYGDANIKITSQCKLLV